VEAWRQNWPSAVATSLARIDAQASAITELAQCARSRDAQFLFLHDFTVADLGTGRDPDRTMMMKRRQAAAEQAGGTFTDLFAVFGTEAGISWFNDFIHPSLVAQERIAQLACSDLN
jgi:hypothetical protein